MEAEHWGAAEEMHRLLDTIAELKRENKELIRGLRKGANMKTLYACRCGSINLWRSADVYVNDPAKLRDPMPTICGDCGYNEGDFYAVKFRADTDLAKIETIDPKRVLKGRHVRI